MVAPVLLFLTSTVQSASASSAGLASDSSFAQKKFKPPAAALRE